MRYETNCTVVVRRPGVKRDARCMNRTQPGETLCAVHARRAEEATMKKPRCPRCSYPVDPEQQMRCPNCKTELRDVRCPGCGRPADGTREHECREAR